jgi:hypothetical protein
MEVRRAVLSANHDLAVDQERVSLKASGGFDNGRKTVSLVVAVAGEAANAQAAPAHHQPVPVVFDFVDPQRPEGGRDTFDGRQGLRKPEGRAMAGG